MAELPDIWPHAGPDAWPDTQDPTPPGALRPVRPIGGQPPRFGVAHDLDLIQRGAAPPPSRSRAQAARRRPPVPPLPSEPGTWDRIGTWWADTDMQPTNLWHRLQCRRGRHEFQGGQQIQLGGRFVNTERRCAWCQTRPL